MVLHEGRDLLKKECLAEEVHLFTVFLLPEDKVIFSNMAIRERKKMEILKQKV